MTKFIEVEARTADNNPQRPFVRCIFRLDTTVCAPSVADNIKNIMMLTSTGNTYLFNMNMKAFKALVEKAEIGEGVAAFEDVTDVSPGHSPNSQ